MQKFKTISTMILASALSLTLIGCATSRGGKGQAESSPTAVETFGITDTGNVLGRDVGPEEDLLGTRSFYFEFDSNRVAEQDLTSIKAHAQYLLDHPTAKVVIEGNCDSRGSREYNVALGQRRADAVQNILRLEGVPEAQLRTVSYGSEKPAALGQTEEAYRLNRRADVVYEAK